MRKLIFIVAIVALGCKSKETPEMPGAYNMMSQSVNDGQKDSTMVGVRQLKIYTGDHMMYAHFTSDSVSSFGIATYSVGPEGVKENMIYTASESTDDTTNPHFDLQIESTPTGYKQVIAGIEVQGKTYSLTEEYELVGAAKTTPIDGAWKSIRRYTVNGKDTSAAEGTQFKIYYASHVVWGGTYLDSAKRQSTAIGFGTFDMTGDNKVKEKNEVSSFASVRGRLIDIDIEFNNHDGFKQTITGTDGLKYIEEYQRLKK